jgi:hypothetical protein
MPFTPCDARPRIVVKMTMALGSPHELTAVGGP